VPADPHKVLYRVVAVRSDGTRVVLASNLRSDRARAIVDALSDVSAFCSLEIEPESGHCPPADDA
jgi:hypothetical protein